MIAVPGLGGGAKPPGDSKSTSEKVSESRKKAKQKIKSWEIAIGFIRFGMIGAAILVVWLNIQPYRMTAEALSTEGAVNAYPLLNWLLSIPVFSGLIQWIASMDYLVQGVCIFLIFQGFELLPKLIEHDADASQKAIALSQSKTNSPIYSDRDDRLTQLLKKKQNDNPKSLIKFLYVAAFVAYIFDFVVSSIAFPPLKSGTMVNSLADFARVGNWMRDVDWFNVFLILLTMYGIEIGVVAWVKLSHILEKLSDRKKTKEKYL